MCRLYHPYCRKWRGTKEPLAESVRREWKAGLKLNVEIATIMASCPITSWQIDGETIENVTDYIFLGSKITADGDCSHEIKGWMLLKCSVGEDSWENPLDSKGIKPVNPKGNQPWIFIRRTDVEVEAPILWPPDVKSCLIRKGLGAGKD